MTNAQTTAPAEDDVRLTRKQIALILLLAAIQFTHMVDFVIIMPLGPRLMRDFQITPLLFGYIVAAYTVSAAVAGLLAAPVVNRFDRKTVMLSMYGGFVASTFACGFAESYTTMLIARAFAGAFGGLSAMAIMTVIGDVFPPRQRGVASGAVMSSFAMASIIGLPIGLQLAGHYDSRGVPFIALAGFSVLVWCLGLSQLPRLSAHKIAAADRPSAWSEFILVASHQANLKAFAFTFLVVLGTFTVVPFIGPYMQNNLGRSEENLSYIYFCAGVVTFIGMTILGRLSDRMSRVLLFRIMASGAIVMTLILTNLPPVGTLGCALVTALFMTFAGGRMVPAQALLINIPSLRHRGPFMSLNTTVQHTASAVAPVLAGIILGGGENGPLTGYWIVGLVAAGFALASIVIAGWLVPKPRPEAGASEPVTPEPVVHDREALAAV